MPPKKPTEKPAAKKTAKKKAVAKKSAVAKKPAVAKKKSSKKAAKKGGKKKSSNPLAQGRALLKTALQGDDYVVELDPKMARKSMEVLSTGSMVLNHLIGGKLNAHGVAPCPGVPRGKILNLYGPEGSGKCLPADALVSTDEGLKTVEEIFAEHQFGCTTANWTKEAETVLINGHGEPERTTHFTSNGKRPLYGLRTFSGKQLRATANHPHLVLTSRGFWIWKKAKEIREGDVLVSQRKIPAGNSGRDKDYAYFLGLLLADGYLGEQRISISNDDPSVKEFLETKVSGFGIGFSEPKQYPNNDPDPGQEPSISYHFNATEPLARFYEACGWSPGVAKDKHTGPAVRCMDADSLRAVLQGYFDCECYIDDEKGEIEVTSASHRLLREVSQLLRVFGIVGLIREKEVPKYPDNDYWKLVIGGSEARSFAEQIGTRSARRAGKLERLRIRVHEMGRSGGTNFDVVPNCGGLLRDLYDASETSRELHDLCADYMGERPRARLTYDRLGQILRAFQELKSDFSQGAYDRLHAIYTREYFYDEVVDVEEASEPVPTFDFAMAETHSFIAEGFVTHNTTIALQTAVETIRGGGTVCYVDWEHEIVPDYAMALGVPIGDDEKFLLMQPDTLDEGIAIVWTMATHGVDLIVLDSVGAGVPKAFFEKSIKDTATQGRVGMNAAVWSAFLPKLKGRINKTRSAVIGISQMRDSINTMGYGDQFTVQGGKAWKYYSALRVRLKKVGTEKASEYSSLSNKTDNRVVGAKVRAKLDKCKVSAQQGNEEDFYIRWGLGVDDLRSLIEIGLAHNVIRKKGAWYRWVDLEGEEIGKNGMEKLRGFFDTNAQARKLLERQVMPFMAAGGSDDANNEEDELDLFGAEPFQDDSELKDILSSISTVPDDDPTDG